MKYIAILILLIFVSCNSNSETSESDVAEESLKSEIMMRGNTKAYHALYTGYLRRSPEDILFWSMYMANKFDYALAYFHVFLSLKNSVNPQFGSYSMMDYDYKTRKMAMDYLHVAVEKQVENAQIAWDSAFILLPDSEKLEWYHR